MGRTFSCDSAVARFAALRHGVLSRRQVMALGFTDDMIATRLGAGRWTALHPGVYSIAGSPDTWERQAIAACLAADRRGAVVSHRSAGRLWRLDGVGVAPMEILVPGGPLRIDGVLVRRTRRFDQADITRLGPIPVTRPARTLIDLAAVLPAQQLEEALDDALRRNLTTLRRLETRIAAVAPPGRAGRGRLLRLIEARRGRAMTASALETRFLRLLRTAGIREPVVERRFDRDGGFAVIDFVFEDEGVAIEVDGFRWHGSRQRWQSDIDRQNEISLAGFIVLRFTAANIEDRPEHTVGQVRRALLLGTSEREVRRATG